MFPLLRPVTSWLERWSPIGGILFVIGAIALAFTPAGDDVGETAAEVVQFARDNEDWMVVAMLFALAVAAPGQLVRRRASTSGYAGREPTPRRC